MAPGDLFVVEGAVAQAADEYSDQSVADYPKCLVVGFPLGPVFVVERPGARRADQRAKGPLAAGIPETMVADEAGQDNLLLPRPACDWGRAGIAAA